MIPSIGSASFRTLQQRHSIVDLSAATSQESSSFLLTSTSSASPHGRRVVASKRRPVNFSGSGNVVQSRFQPKVSDSNLAGSTCFKQRSSSFDSETTTNSNLPSFRLVLKDFSRKQCALFEPVVTFRAFLQFHPVLQTCVNYLKQQFENKQIVASYFSIVENNASYSMDVPSSSASFSSVDPNIIENFLKLQVINEQYLTGLRKLETYDIQIMRQVKSIEIEHYKLHSFQSQWALSCAIEQEKTVLSSETDNKFSQKDELTTTPHYKVLPWETTMLKRLEQLDSAKEGLETLFESATAVCKDLDNLIETAVSNIVNLMEFLGLEPRKYDLRWKILERPNEEKKDNTEESVKEEFFSPVHYNDVLAIKKKKIETPVPHDSSLSTDLPSLAQNEEDVSEKEEEAYFEEKTIIT